MRRAAGFLLGLVARLWLLSLRLTLVVSPDLAASSARPWVLSFWHGQQFALLRWRRRRPTVALVSLSRDGVIQASALPRVGLVIERGSSSRGGASGLRAVVRRLRAGLDAAFAVDGPRGPRGVVRSDAGGVGATLAAKLAGGVVVPAASASSRAWIFSRAWDRYELPWPFARVAVVLGPPIEPDDAGPAALGRAIDAARREALAALGRADDVDSRARAEEGPPA
jgi:lysophospholipid acyltransferase (LPLAT)-like uncharacterized protein